MKLEHQVTSLEISQRLKELGMNKESLHSWCYIQAHGGYELDNGDSPIYSAYTVAELGEILAPVGSKINTSDIPVELQLTDDDYISIFLAEYWGKMLIYLLEQNLISLTDINK